MRIGIAALIGAIILFVWQTISHMALPIGEMGFRVAPDEDPIIQSIAAGAPEAGVYMLPGLDPAKYGDPATMAAWEAKAKSNRFSFLVVSPAQADPMNMVPNLSKQFVSNLLAALLATWLLAATAWTFGTRVLGGLAFGLFGWLANIVPQWNWYRFPTDFVIGGLLDQGIGWLLAGVGIAWWLGRR